VEIPEKIESCAENIKKKLGLAKTPRVLLYSRPFEKTPDLWIYTIDSHKYVSDTTESMFFWDDTFNRDYLYPVGDLSEEYPLIFDAADKNGAFKPLFTEVLIIINRKIKVSAAYNYMITGTLLNGQKFMAILALYVRELFTGCGLASLIKLEEIRLASEEGCDFIHTWHEYNNPNLSSAILPGLKTGFLLFQANENDGIGHNGDCSIHLRKYFRNSHSSEVYIENLREPLKSPDQNEDIINALLTAKRRNKGKIFEKISMKSNRR